ncbi:apolipoprotein N-acyltransferase [Tundrisphaera sp. TA3]|uniref:apolipoprotein N-acyltransferase n=1 Tax=Tundrisphaera sp. TA3 TaxID=3435775 RepID=UPI003EBD2142
MMMSQLVSANDPDGSRPTPPQSARSGMHPAKLAVGAAVLLWASFPPAEWNWLAWFALAPLFLLVGSDRPARPLYLGSWLGGFAFWLLAVHWVWWTDPSAWLGWIVMAGVLSLWWPGFLFLARYGTRKLDLPLMIAAPVAWVALEQLRAHILGGFPWYYLAHGQYRMLYLTQIADFSGALGLSFVMAVVNAFWVDLLTRPLFRAGASGGSAWSRMTRDFRVRSAVVLVMVAGTVGYGAFRVHTARFREGPRLGMLQSSEVQRYNSHETKDRPTLLALYESLMLRATRANPAPDLLVWPETAYPYSYADIDPKLDPKALETQVKEIDPDFIGDDWRKIERRTKDLFARWMANPGIPMMVGSSTYHFRPEGYERYNSAVLLQPGGLAPQFYHKIRLVPFGEYVPLVDVFPWLMALTPYRGQKVHFLGSGKDPAWFRFGRLKMAAAICFEDTLPAIVRRFFSEVTDGHEPDILVNLSNDGWFHQTSEHEMHLAISVFRCIENRVPLARAVNTGISAVVDGNGRIVASLGKLKEGVLIASVPLDDRVALYSRWGDWVGLSCLAATIGMIPLGYARPRLRRARA